MPRGVARLCKLVPVALSLVTVAPSRAQEAGTGCPPGGFDVCFPNLEAGAPGAACDPEQEGAAEVSACLADVCGGVAAEPEPGFFSYCCAAGGSVRYDDFCVFVVQDSCADIAAFCADRCPPLDLLLGSVALAPPPESCLPGYPDFIAAICQSDPFCCTTSWDALCAGEALEASGGS